MTSSTCYTCALDLLAGAEEPGRMMVSRLDVCLFCFFKEILRTWKYLMHHTIQDS